MSRAVVTDDRLQGIGKGFRNYFQAIAEAKHGFIVAITADEFMHIASVVSLVPVADSDDESSPGQ